jgi:uncharacterized protein (TIGR02266 family)
MMITNDSKFILIADDSLFFRARLEDILTEGGHRVRLSTNGKETIEAMRVDAEKIDLLILAVKMPDIDCFGVMDWIDENGLSGKFPVLIMTNAYKINHMLERLKGSVATGLMRKDFSPQEVILRVNRQLFHNKAGAGAKPRGRVPVSTAVDFTIGDKTETGFLLNISEGGVFINTSAELSIDTSVKLVFSLPGIDRVFELTGIVKWSTAKVASKTTFCGSGLIFINVSSEDQEVLRRFVTAEMKRLRLYDYGEKPSPVKATG